MLSEMGRYPEAVEFTRSGADAARRVFGPDDPQTSRAINNLGTLYIRMGDLESGLPLFEEAPSTAKTDAARAAAALEQLYERWNEDAPGYGYDEEAARWRATLSAGESSQHE